MGRKEKEKKIGRNRWKRSNVFNPKKCYYLPLNLCFENHLATIHTVRTEWDENEGKEVLWRREARSGKKREIRSFWLKRSKISFFFAPWNVIFVLSTKCIIFRSEVSQSITHSHTYSGHQFCLYCICLFRFFLLVCKSVYLIACLSFCQFILSCHLPFKS